MAQVSGSYALVRVNDDLQLKLTRQGILPAPFIEHLLQTMDVGDAIEQYRQPAQPGARVGLRTGREEAWTKESLAEALEVLAKSDPTATHLIFAYSDLNPRPTVAELRETCGFDSGPGHERIWEQELRLAKRRIGDLARERRRAQIFQAPVGNGDDRVHPMQPEVHAWVRAWAESREPAEPPLRWGADPTLATRYAHLLT